MAFFEKIAAAAGFRTPQLRAARPQPETLTLFVGHGRWLLADDLGSADPFCLLPGQIVDRVILAGHQPSPAAPGPVVISGKAEDVEREGRRFRVWRDPDAETITVQEIRAAAACLDASAGGGRPD